VMAVSGGRNLGDAYFGKASDGNFIDLDLLVAGPAVQDLSRSFDSYWNNERAYPVQSLVSHEELDKIRSKARADAAAKREKQQAASHAPNVPASRDGTAQANEPVPAADPRQGAWDMKPMDLDKADFTWAPAAVMADKPAKIAPDSSTAGVASGKAPGLVVTKVSARSVPSVDGAPQRSIGAAAATAASGDTVVEGLLQLIGQARHDLLIISPYFVPGPEMEHAFAEARSRGVRIRVLTNSLASNDAPVAHVGYARHREELLAMGIELYELRSDQAGLGSAFGAGSGGNVTGQSRSMLHSKVLVMDGQLLVVGSMNLDLRSQLQNTEIAVLIHSDTLSATATEKIESVLKTGAWHVQQQDGHLVWRAPEGSGLADSSTEPDSSAGLRLVLKLFGPLAPDKLL
jgi:cardiolipin synthase C